MISFPVGTDFPCLVQALDINGNVMVLTDASVVQFNVYYQPREGRAVVKEYTLSSGVTITDGANGYCRIDFVAEDLDVGEYVVEGWAVLADDSLNAIGRQSLYVTQFTALE